MKAELGAGGGDKKELESVIVRLMREGQYRVSEDVGDELSGLDDQAVQALDGNDEAELDARLEEMWSLVRARASASRTTSSSPRTSSSRRATSASRRPGSCSAATGSSRTCRSPELPARLLRDTAFLLLHARTRLGRSQGIRGGPTFGCATVSFVAASCRMDGPRQPHWQVLAGPFGVRLFRFAGLL